MNSKAKGSRAERKTIDILESKGYFCTKSAASLGIFDVIAIGKQGIKLVQVKSNRNPPGQEMEILVNFAKNHCPEGAKVEVWVWKDRVKEPVIKCLN